MEKIKNNFTHIIVCLFEIIVGILLLINPIGFTTGIITAAGIVIMITGVFNIIKYFTSGKREAAMGQYLTKGLISLLGGGFCAFKSHWFIVTFPALTIIYGLTVLVVGVSKVQLTVDLIRRKSKEWFIVAISAAISIICASVILASPFSSTSVLWMFTGISLIVEAVVDFVTLFIGNPSNNKE